jgi:hypothetical protein
MNRVMKKFFLFLLLICTGINLKAETAEIYKTFEDYKSGNPELIEDVTSAYWSSDSFGNRVVFEREDKKKKRVKLKDFWGFKYKGRLFRSINKSTYKDLACVVDSGKVIFYMNGGALLTLLKEGANFGFMEQGSAECFVSLDYNSDIVSTHWNNNGNKVNAPRTKTPFNKFKEMYPQFQELYDCIGETYSTYIARKCIENFNKK